MGAGNGRQILIVDEDVLTVIEAEAALREASYQTAHLTTPAGFWAKLDYVRPDVLLIDINMNRFNGIGLLGELREREDYEDMVIVLFSDREADELQQICVDNDVNGYFCKSHEMSQLPEFIENFE
jgi:DNA-binding NarL/FixJ family response regulator